MAWLATESGYEVSLDGTKVVARSSSGRTLKSVPAALKNDPLVENLKQVATWLGQHDREVGARVEALMIRSLPLARAELTAVWSDDSWRSWLTDLVVRADVDGVSETGFLRDTDPDRGIGLVNLDGESVWVAADVVRLPHPVLLGDDLAELREFAIELGVNQRVPQLMREVWTRGDRLADATSITDFSGGRYDRLLHLTSRASSLGYAVRGGFAVCPVWEDGRSIDACVWVGAEDPTTEAETGELVFTEGGSSVPLANVGPVAFSEGMRMAAGLWAGRKVDDEDDEERPQ